MISFKINKKRLRFNFNLNKNIQHVFIVLSQLVSVFVICIFLITT